MLQKKDYLTTPAWPKLSTAYSARQREQDHSVRADRPATVRPVLCSGARLLRGTDGGHLDRAETQPKNAI